MRQYPHKEFKDKFMAWSKEELIDYLYLSERQCKTSKEVIALCKEQIKSYKESIEIYRNQLALGRF